MTTSVDFYTWVVNIGGQGTGIKKSNVTITLLDDDLSTELAIWQLTNAWPCKYTGPDFNASVSEIAFESIELVHDGVTRTT
jgi:phage tail-like protein